MTDQASAIARLLDENAIMRLATFYTDGVNRLNYTQAASVYAPDGRLTAFGGPDICGRAAITDALRQTFSPFNSLHQICHSGIIELSGNVARARWSIYELQRREVENGVSLFTGAYEDDLVRLDEGWRFSKRRLRAVARARIDASKIKDVAIAPPEFEFVL